jgi:hypothetical protein
MAGNAAAPDGRELKRAVERGPRVSELARLRAVCRRQGLLIDRFCETISVLRSGASALKAENAALRADPARATMLRPAAASGGELDTPLVQACLSMDVHAPAAARQLIADRLRVELGPRRLEMAQLLISELVTECLSDAAVSEQTLVIRVRLDGGHCRLEVEVVRRGGVPGRSSRVRAASGAPRLELRHELCDAWGTERLATGGIRSWADLGRPPRREGEPRSLRLAPPPA